MGLEALSRGAASAVFVEIDKEGIRCIQRNIETLGFEDRAKVFAGDVFQMMRFFSKKGMQFNIIFADPPYDTIENAKILHAVDNENLLAHDGVLFIEDSYRAKRPEEIYQTLKVKSCREMGRSSLKEYERIASVES